ncbi:Protein of unknown function [Nocardioides terrae]|uniref:DUF4012 domain-containing protein n=1 Tax=Nocardioides terrae TaxID=574651 RepID=A0A1I1EKZ4_9ACTN|nr:DUF4012 domain-containing protein [Nocardioides terrae]SFB87839.1 Protein of unknown function [Nocardioides terrae]
MRLQHPWRLLAGVIAVLLLAVGAYAGWLLWSTARSLSSAADDARSLRVAIEAGDDRAIDAAFANLSDKASTAKDSTDSPVWSLMTHVPGFGDDARGVRIVSRAAAGLTSGGLADLAHQAGDLDALLPAKGGIDLATVQHLQKPVADGHAALARADEQLSAENPSGFVESLRLKYRDLHRQVRDAADALDVADKAMRVLPTMLGAEGERHYLLVMQNNAEIRATGGLPGAVSLVTAKNGKLTMTKQVPGGALGEADEPVLPLSKEETDLFGEQLGTYFVDANFTPDFPRTAALMKARWEHVEGGNVDGVISIDPVALSYLLRATGPVTAAGVAITADNAVDELLHDVYVDIPEPSDQDVFFRQVAAAVFAKLTAGGGDRSQLLSALRQGANEHRLLVHDFHPAAQTVFAGTAVAGELSPANDKAPQVGIYFNDSTGAKMSYYLRYDVQVTSTSCKDGVQSFAGKLTVKSTAPADAASLPDYVTGGGQFGIDAGNQIVNVQIYGPQGGSVGPIRTNGKNDDAQQVGTLSGRPLRQIWLLLEPGKSADVDWAMRSGPAQTSTAQISMTPSVEVITRTVEAGSAC